MTTALTTITLTDVDFRELISAQHDGDATTCRDLTDTSGIPVVRAGTLTPEVSDLVQLITRSRGTFMAQRCDSEALLDDVWLWSGGNGIISAVKRRGGDFVLTAAPATDIYRTVIDAVALQARPRPLDDGPTVKVGQKDLTGATDGENGAEAARAAQRILGETIRKIHPGIADSLTAGEMEHVTVYSEFKGVRGPVKSSQLFLDTPAGILMHATSGMRFMPRHHLTAVPAWAVWEEIVKLLPRPEDFVRWSREVA
ncbi:hypothetical protein GCM10008096_15670 [Zhihengliuella salsuginis]|uniref:EspG family protein n=2 Tax=Zhihengliuella salsuginis TaxID=578222 RepID=A0ABQ3GHG1_9MICC|nr:hypothetical protein GCM10008096_15670 [Zhihengliuella salsuginis]